MELEKFNYEENGYNKKEVNQFVGEVIRETEEIITRVKKQKKEILTKLKKEINKKRKKFC